jgi:glycosyltransferase 2 family protein
VFGQFTNNFVPGRAGDLLRVLYLGRHAEASRSFALATTLTERVLDAAILTAVALFAMLWLESIPDWMATGVRVLALLSVVAVVLLVAVPFLEPYSHRLIDRIPLPQAVRERLSQMIPRFVLGLKALHQPMRASAFLVLTLLIWLSDAMSMVVWALALHLSLSLKQAVVLNALLALSQILPITPGGIGVYQYLAVTVLMPFGFSRSQALAYTVSLQALFYVLVAALGCVALIRPEARLYVRRGLPTDDSNDKTSAI